MNSMLTNQPFFLTGSTQADTACLLLHGLGGGVYEMELLGQFLHRQGFTVQGISYPGHDRAATKMPASTWQQWFSHILNTYLHLTQHYRQVNVIGFSTGCPLGLHLATLQPVHKLVLLSPYLAIRYQWYYLLPPEAYLYAFGWLVEDLPRLSLPIRDRETRTAAERVFFFKTFNLAAVRSAAQLIDIVKPQVPSITAPTLIIQPSQDSVVAPWGAEWLYNNIGAVQKKLHWLEQSDHICPLDLEREQVFSLVGNFCKE
jgi:carboxylesterase